MNKKNSHEQTDIENNNTKRNDIDRDQIEKTVVVVQMVAETETLARCPNNNCRNLFKSKRGGSTHIPLCTHSYTIL